MFTGFTSQGIREDYVFEKIWMPHQYSFLTSLRQIFTHVFALCRHRANLLKKFSRQVSKNIEENWKFVFIIKVFFTLSQYFWLKQAKLLFLLREYWTIYRGAGFLSVVWYGSSYTPSPLVFRQKVVSLSQSSRSSLLIWKGGGGGEGGAESDDDEKNLVLFKSFNTLWFLLSYEHWIEHIANVKRP
jgi:hypothetical protein